MTKSKPMYIPGDLVELARFGHLPEKDEDRVYATVIENLDSSNSSYHVPLYRVRILGSKKSMTTPFGSRFEQDNRVTSVLEYDLLPANREESQD